MREYVYHGPVSSIQIRGQRKGVRLVDGGRVWLPPADPRVRRLVARKALVPVDLELEFPPPPSGEHFPASEQPTRSGKKKRKARRARSMDTQKSEPPASGNDFDAGGDHVAPETSEDP